MDVAVKLHTKQRHCSGRNAEVDGDLFKFKGAGDAVGVVKILEPTSPILNYYEYEIIDRGEKCAIGIGVADQGYPLDRMPGWNPQGIGYHADDGRLFFQDGFGKPFGPTSSVGDRMGCGVDFDTDVGYGYVSVFFTRNGQQVGEPVKMKRPIHGLYPVVGLHSCGEKVRYLGHSRRLPHTLAQPMDLETSPWSMWLRSNGVRFVDDGLTVEYCGEGLEGQDVGMAQGNFCLDRRNHYFEMEILSAGKEGWLAIGVAKSTYPLHRHPGWNKGSIGYHADNGQLYKEVGRGVPFGPSCTEGDRMGCGILFPALEDGTTPSSSSETDSDMEPTAEFGYEENGLEGVWSGSDSDYSGDEPDFLKRLRVKYKAVLKQKALVQGEKRHTKTRERACTVYFTKNGERVGTVECPVPSGGFYPVVAMLSLGEKVRVNFEPLTG